jgi:MFS family permease
MNTQNPWKVILPLCAVLVIDGMTIGVVFPELAPMFLNPKTAILPAHTSELMRHLYYGLSLSLPSLLMFFGAPILGDLSDRFGRKRVLIAGLFGVALSCLLS